MTTRELFQWWLELHWAWGMLVALLAAGIIGGGFLGTLTEVSGSLKQIAREIRALRETKQEKAE